MLQTKAVEKIKTHFIFNNIFPKNRTVYEIMWENMIEPGRTQVTLLGACALHAGYLRLQTPIHSIQYLRLLYSDNGYANAPQYYVIHTGVLISP